MSITASEARKQLFPLIEKVDNDRVAVEITFSSRERRTGVRGRVRRPRGDRLLAPCASWSVPTSVETEESQWVLRVEG
ncbi:MAG: hypothetical protein ACR2FV_17535, partial [Ornithinimicrobium sp.]